MKVHYAVFSQLLLRQTSIHHLRFYRTLAISLFFCVSIFSVQPAWSDTSDQSKIQKTHEYTLENGLKLIVREDHRAPVIVFQVWYKVGSSYEPVGLTGISHALEHMMFKGTHRLPPGEFSKIVADYGGKENAFTSRDYTGYFQLWEASRLPMSFELEADRMINLTLPTEEFAKEIQVVMEERRLRTEDNPNAKTSERFHAAAYVSSSYHTPIIGWMRDLEQMTVDDLRNWYQQWYAPNNATVVIVGDVNPDEVSALAEKYFGSIPSQEIPRASQPTEVEPIGERRITVKLPAKLPALYMGFNVPSVNTAENDWEPYALQMLAGVLDGGYSARIETELVRRQEIAAGVGAGYSPFSRGDTLLTISGVPHQNHTIDALESAIFEQLDILKKTLATTDELEPLKAQVISSLIYQQDSISSQANQIGRFESIGLPWQLANQIPENLDKITPEQIQKVAKKYLIRDRLTVAVLNPRPLSGKPKRNRKATSTRH